MLDKRLADKLTTTAVKQLEEGLKAKAERMDEIAEYVDLYNNKTMEFDETTNFPFPYFANFIDSMRSKIDDPPRLDFRIPNHKTVSRKVKSAWEQEKSSTRAGWSRKDRAEKNIALLSGRGVAKVYSSSVDNSYKSHYDVVDIYSFVADPTRGHLEDGNYHGETDIFRTEAELERGAKKGWYDKAQVELLFTDNPDDGDPDVLENKYDRLRANGIDVETLSYAGQKGKLLTEWVMKYGGEWYYLLFCPKKGVWIRAELLKDAFASGKTPFVSWATHYDEFNFWSKSLADDIAPITEATRLLLNTAIENEKRRTRPMRAVESGALVDVSQLQEYVPDEVILFQQGRNPNIIDIQTPEISTTIDLVEYLDKSSQNKVGLQEQGIDEKDAKVGIFYGQLQQEADRVGLINKEYSESYAQKGYRFFWGLKQNLTGKKAVEMLGGKGLKLQYLTKMDFKDVDDVDDVIVSGGSAQDELDAVKSERQMKVIGELTAAYGQSMNPEWVIRQSLRIAEFDEEDISEALDAQGMVDRELMEEADEAIQDVLLGNPVSINNGANVQWAKRILDFVTDELDWVTLKKDGSEKIDKEMRDHAMKLLALVERHKPIIIGNMQRDVRAQSLLGQQPEQGGKVELPVPTEQEKQQAAARPFEGGTPTPQGTAETSQRISQTLTT